MFSLYSLLQDYEAAISVYDTILNKDCSCKANLLSGMGRIYLQVFTGIKINIVKPVLEGHLWYKEKVVF
jgi:hypothetical protein